MPGKTLVRKFFLPVYLVLLGALVLAALWTHRSLQDFFLQQTRQKLETSAALLVPQVSAWLQQLPAERLQARCRDLGETSGIHITVVGPGGRVQCDSREAPSRLPHLGSRPEIQQALSGTRGLTMPPAAGSGGSLAVALPVVLDGSPPAALRAALDPSALQAVLAPLRNRLLVIGLTLAVVLGGGLFWISRRVGSIMNTLKTHTRRMAEGDFEGRLPLTGAEEYDSLGRTLNDMAEQLHERIHIITKQGNEQQAILASMVEGVFAVDAQETVIHLNQAASRLFGKSLQAAQGRPLQEVVRNTKLQEFVRKVLASHDPLEADVEFSSDGEVRFLQVRGTLLRNQQDQRFGAVFVLNDVTRLRKLETLRRDFVANVSHELKTPITSIKGFVETLLDGAMNSPEDAQRFLEIVSKQAERLNAIIEDLLSLSRIEEESESKAIVRENCRIQEVLENAVGDCSPKAQAKAIQLHLDCDADLRAWINSPLLEEAVVNLVDNAIKYSDPDKRVEIEARRDNGALLIRVADQGRGIDQEHLPRLFERFYRVDKARSRNLGGTGLGLAIVKHIAQAHGGQVEVQSTPGVGSVFSLRLPFH